jgi:hypothetical protein
VELDFVADLVGVDLVAGFFPVAGLEAAAGFFPVVGFEPIFTAVPDALAVLLLAVDSAGVAALMGRG